LKSGFSRQTLQQLWKITNGKDWQGNSASKKDGELFWELASISP
jgi:hypothetical protein